MSGATSIPSSATWWKCAIKQTREQETRKVQHRAEDHAEERILDALLPPARDGGDADNGSGATRQKFRKMLREGELDDKEIEIEVAAAQAQMEILAPPGMEDLTSQIQGMFQNLGSCAPQDAQAEDHAKR